jgi:hypothetical protein
MSTLASGSSSYGYDPFEPAPKRPWLARMILVAVIVLFAYLIATQ